MFKNFETEKAVSAFSINPVATEPISPDRKQRPLGLDLQPYSGSIQRRQVVFQETIPASCSSPNSPKAHCVSGSQGFLGGATDAATETKSSRQRQASCSDSTCICGKDAMPLVNHHTSEGFSESSFSNSNSSMNPLSASESLQHQGISAASEMHPNHFKTANNDDMTSETQNGLSNIPKELRHISLFQKTIAANRVLAHNSPHNYLSAQLSPDVKRPELTRPVQLYQVQATSEEQKLEMRENLATIIETVSTKKQQLLD